MTIYALKSRFQGLLRPMVRRLRALGVTANQVTIAACLFIRGGRALPLRRRSCLVPAPADLDVCSHGPHAVDGMLAPSSARARTSALTSTSSTTSSPTPRCTPLAFIPPFRLAIVGAVIFIASLTEMTGVSASWPAHRGDTTARWARRPSAFVFALLAIWVATTTALPEWTSWIMVDDRAGGDEHDREPHPIRTPRSEELETCSEQGTKQHSAIQGSDNHPRRRPAARPDRSTNCPSAPSTAPSCSTSLAGRQRAILGTIVLFHRGHEHSGAWLTWSTSLVSTASLSTLDARGHGRAPGCAASARAEPHRLLT